MIPLGIAIGDGIEILELLGVPQAENDGNEVSFRVTTPEFEIAIYDEQGSVKSVWFNDPAGRVWRFGKTRKVRLYLQRYGDLENWELRMNNGWMKYYFNEKSKVAMVYGIHHDVIQFNVWRGA